LAVTPRAWLLSKRSAASAIAAGADTMSAVSAIRWAALKVMVSFDTTFRVIAGGRLPSSDDAADETRRLGWGRVLRYHGKRSSVPMEDYSRAAAWVVALLKAHGVDPRWRKGSYKDLSLECQQRLREINLHWHDLRREYASRLVERGVPLAQVRDLLGHASILTTKRYENQRLETLQAAVERLEGGKTFDPKIEATDNVSRIFQDPTKQRFAEREDPITESARSH
jgi:hypothetical protein